MRTTLSHCARLWCVTFSVAIPSGVLEGQIGRAMPSSDLGVATEDESGKPIAIDSRGAELEMLRGARQLEQDPDTEAYLLNAPSLLVALHYRLVLPLHRVKVAEDWNTDHTGT